MTTEHDPARHRDEVDVLVDDLLADPGRADEVKAALRRRLGAPPARRRGGRPRAAEPVDLWDNVPV